MLRNQFENVNFAQFVSTPKMEEFATIKKRGDASNPKILIRVVPRKTRAVYLMEIATKTRIALVKYDITTISV